MNDVRGPGFPFITREPNAADVLLIPAAFGLFMTLYYAGAFRVFGLVP